MLASLLMWNSSMENTGRKEPVVENNVSEDQQDQVIGAAEAAKQRGRKSGKLSQKKPPQRGLGVAQLERLRLQERWKKITEIDQAHQLHTAAPNHHHQFQFQFQFPFPFSDHQTTSSVSYSKLSPATYGSSAVVTHPTAGFHPCTVFTGGATGSSGEIPVAGELHKVDRIRIAAGELSSSQKMHGMLDRKAFDGEINLGFNGGRGQSAESMMPPVDNCDLLRLNLGQNSSGHDGSRGNRLASYSSANVKEEVEVVAVHRRGNPMGGSVLMEYEFFPCRSSSSSSSNKDSSIAETQPAAVVMGEASPSNTNTNTNWIDLSLRLSC